MGLLNSIGSIFGLGGQQGSYFVNQAINSQAKKDLEGIEEAGTNDSVKDIASKLSSGGASLADVLAAAKASGNQENAMSYLAQSPVAGSALASQQVREDPTLGKIYGDGGSYDQALSEEDNLAHRGYSLQPEDYEAYGQGSDNLARMFGTQEQSLASTLANRGLAAGNSGAAGAQFTGLQGNKNEQLGALQRQIANDRMTNNLARLTETRNYITSLNGQDLQAQNQMYNQNQTRENNLQDKYGKDISAYSAENQAAIASSQDRKANEGLGLSDVLGSGISQGISTGIGVMGGAAGNKLGGSLGLGGQTALVSPAATTKKGS